MAAGLEDSITGLLAPSWNGARSIAPREASPYVLPQALNAAPISENPVSSASAAAVPVVGPLVINEPVARVISPSSTALSGTNAQDTTFTVRLGRTYYERGFFNVPVTYSKLFDSHGATVELYCGAKRAHVRAILDRKANQRSGTPRIYGKRELASWLQGYFQLDDMLKVTVLSPTTAVLT